MAVTVTKYELSDQLCDLIGVPSGTLMRRDWAMKEVTHYMISNKLIRELRMVHSVHSVFMDI